MKKNYTNPTAEIAEIEAYGFICASGSNEDFGNGPDYGKDIFEMIPQPKPF